MMTRHVVNYTGCMSRWEPGAAQRLRSAALDLFVEHGFANVTVPQITERAGLTTRTFFRHFTDKREVLFAGEEALPEVMAQVFAEAPASLTPLEVITRGLTEIVAPRFEGLRDHLRLRRGVVRSDEGLRERELRKSALIAEAGTEGFRTRGLPEREAALAARLAATVLDTALAHWLDDDTDRPLTDHVTATIAALRTLVTPAQAASHRAAPGSEAGSIPRNS